MLDKILVALSMAAVVAFLGVVLGFVAEPDLIVATSLIIALALHDFWISVFRPRESASSAKSDIPLEALPTGVSGKPATRKKKAPTKKKPAAKRGKK